MSTPLAQDGTKNQAPWHLHPQEETRMATAASKLYDEQGDESAALP
jgi:hypothetical protein